MIDINWTTLLLTPFISLPGSFLTAYIALRIDRSKTINQELIKKRISVNDQMINILNDIYCFHTGVGDWRSMRPKDIIDKKRKIDKIFHVNKAIYSTCLSRKYNKYIDLCFKTCNGSGLSAKMLFEVDPIKTRWGDEWDNNWDQHFIETSPEPPEQAGIHYKPGARTPTPLAELEDAYLDLERQFSVEIGARKQKLFHMRKKH